MKKTVCLDENGYRKFGLRDKLAYAAGDFGCNMSFALKGTLSIFWTQFMRIDSIVFAGLLLVVQIWDAINDPLIGTLIDSDRRKYRLGKFRTYILIGSIGLLFAGALCFVPVPGAPSMAKNIIFIAGYVLWDAFYTIANVPYGSMLPLISSNAGERAQLSTWRSVGSMLGNGLTMALLPVLIYDSNDNLVGERVFIIAIVMGVIGFAAFQYMIYNTVERVDLTVNCKEDVPKFNLFKAILNFFRNRPALGATLAPVAMFIGMYGAQTASTVTFQSYFHKASLSGVLQIVGYLPLFFFMPFIRQIVDKWGKKEATAATSIVSVIACILMFVLPITPDGKGIAIFLACQILNGLGQGVYQCVSYSMMADAIDYNEWKYGLREEGTIYSLHSFCRKLAQGVGPSLGLVLAVWLGYVAENQANQTPEVAKNMLYLYIAMTLIGAALRWISVAFIYNLDKKTLAQMQSELAERRSAGTAAEQED
ncbi:MAG: MFS transporter [Acutalibacteraceae bacterium]